MPRYVSYVGHTTRDNTSPTHPNTCVGYVGYTPKETLDTRRSRALAPGPCLGADGESWRPEQRVCLTAGAGYVRGDDVSRMAVERYPGAVVAHGRPQVAVARRLLDITERHACVQGGGDKGVP